VIISTMNDLPGYEIEEVLGEVFGLTVRARNIGSQFGAGLKSLVGGELKGMTKMLAEGRQHATDRLIEEAESKGAMRRSRSRSSRARRCRTGRRRIEHVEERHRDWPRSRSGSGPRFALAYSST
jgi:putative heavy-metal-binding protein